MNSNDHAPKGETGSFALAVNLPEEPIRELRGAHLTLPHDNWIPSDSTQCFKVLLVPANICFQLFIPIQLIRRWTIQAVLAIVSVPKATMHKYDRPVLRKADIWSPGQVSEVQAEPKTKTMEERTYEQFWLRVTTPYT